MARTKKLKEYEFSEVHDYHLTRDPVRPDVQWHRILLKIKGIPKEAVPTELNPREVKLNQRIVKMVRSSLLKLDPAAGDMTPFHFKHNGVDILANDVLWDPENKRLTVWIDHNDLGNQGTLNGAHTMALVAQVVEHVDDDQFVWVTISTNLPQEDVLPMSNGRNTAVAVTASSFIDKMGDFDWMKSALRPIDAKIRWHQNQPDTLIDVVDLIRWMQVMHPRRETYSKVPAVNIMRNGTGAILGHYAFNVEAFYMPFRPVLQNLLQLSEAIQNEGPIVWDAMRRRRKKFCDTAFARGDDEKPLKEASAYDSVFGGKMTNVTHRFFFVPLMAAYAAYLDFDEATQQIQWKVPFKEFMTKTFKDTLPILIKTIINEHEDNPDVGGMTRSNVYWETLRLKLENYQYKNASNAA